LSNTGTMRKGGNRSFACQTDEQELSMTRQIDEETQTEVDEKDVESESDSVFSSVDDKSTETETVETSEKAVNTRSRSLHHSVQSSSSMDAGEGQNGYQDAPSSPSAQRRHRRRRERTRQEVSAPMTATVTNAEPQPQVSISRAPVLSYSSSIDDTYCMPSDGGTSTTGQYQYKAFSQFGRDHDDIPVDFEFN